MKDFRKLKVWEAAHGFVLRLYPVTRQFPKEELYGLISQIRRAATSIPCNIAEGCGRNGDKELNRFLSYSMGSASEVEYQLELARDLGYLKEKDYVELNEELLSVKKC